MFTCSQRSQLELPVLLILRYACLHGQGLYNPRIKHETHAHLASLRLSDPFTLDVNRSDA